MQRRKIRTRPRDIGAALSAVLLVGGCGSGGEAAPAPPPQLPRALAADLAGTSDRVAALLGSGDACAALDAARDLRAATIAAINARRVPSLFQEPLQSAANDLTLRIRCIPPARTGGGSDKGKGKHGKRKHGKSGDE